MNHFLMGLKIELKSALQMPRSSSEAKTADTPLLNEHGMQQIHKNQKEKSLFPMDILDKHYTIGMYRHLKQALAWPKQDSSSIAEELFPFPGWLQLAPMNTLTQNVQVTFNRRHMGSKC